MVTVLLRTQERHLAVFELATLLEAADEVNSRLRAQAGDQQDMPAALVRLIQTELSFQQFFTSHLPVRWPHLTPLIRTLTMGHFRPDTVTMPGVSDTTCRQHSLHTKRQSRLIEHWRRGDEMTIPPHHKWRYKTQTNSPTSNSARGSDSNNP